MNYRYVEITAGRSSAAAYSLLLFAEWRHDANGQRGRRRQVRNTSATKVTAHFRSDCAFFDEEPTNQVPLNSEFQEDPGFPEAASRSEGLFS